MPCPGCATRGAIVAIAVQFSVAHRAREFRAIVRATAAASIPAILAACMSQPSYPGAVGPQEARSAGLKSFSVSSCPRLGGRYLDQGNRVEVDGSLGLSVSLTQLLTGAIGAADVVTVTYAPDESLVVDSWKGAEKVSSWRRPAWNPFTLMMREETALTTSYRCEFGTIIVETAFGGGGVVGVGVAESRTQLQVSERADGTLAVRHVDRNAGLIVVVPYYQSKSIWYRFPTPTVAEGK